MPTSLCRAYQISRNETQRKSSYVHIFYQSNNMVEIKGFNLGVI